MPVIHERPMRWRLVVLPVSHFHFCSLGFFLPVTKPLSEFSCALSSQSGEWVCESVFCNRPLCLRFLRCLPCLWQIRPLLLPLRQAVVMSRNSCVFIALAPRNYLWERNFTPCTIFFCISRAPLTICGKSLPQERDYFLFVQCIALKPQLPC